MCAWRNHFLVSSSTSEYCGRRFPVKKYLGGKFVTQYSAGRGVHFSQILVDSPRLVMNDSQTFQTNLSAGQTLTEPNRITATYGSVKQCVLRSLGGMQNGLIVIQIYVSNATNSGRLGMEFPITLGSCGDAITHLSGSELTPVRLSEHPEWRVRRCQAMVCLSMTHLGLSEQLFLLGTKKKYVIDSWH